MRPRANSRIREFDLIRALKRRYGTRTLHILRSIGDDAAVIAAPERRRPYLLTTDLLAEGIHFDRRIAAFADIGFRAAAANLSDIAAMGGLPKYLLISLAIPCAATRRQVNELYGGIMDACRPYRVKIIGGDTSASAGGWFINITLIGSAALGRVLFRSGARAGDDLYVTGTLGDSRAGLQLLKGRTPKAGRRALTPVHRRFLIRRHLRPTARIPEGMWLSKTAWATSAIDLSDGLSGDLRHLCTESNVGAVLDLSALPISSACRRYAQFVKEDVHRFALAGGEDYELLFTVPARHRLRFHQASVRHRFAATRVGRMTRAKHGIQMTLPNGRRRPLPDTGYEHFVHNR